MTEKTVSFKIETKELIAICKVLGKYQSDILMTADITGLSCIQVENTNVSLIDMFIPGENLRDYFCKEIEKEGNIEPIKFVLPCLALSKGFLATSEGIISVVITDENIISFSTENNTAEYVGDINTVRKNARYSYDEMYSYSLVKSMNFKEFLEFKKLTDTIKKVDKRLQVVSFEHNLYLNTCSDNANKLSFKSEGIYSDKKQTCLYSTKYLKEITDSIKLLKPEKVEIKLMQDRPLVISCNVGSYQNFRFVLAPIIDHD